MILAWIVLAGAILPYLALGRVLGGRLPVAPAAGEPPPLPRISALEFMSLLVVLALTVGLGVHGIDRGLDYDELFTANFFVEVNSFVDTVSRYIVFNNHIAYSILARLARLAFGRTEWALRLPALILAVAGVISLWYFVRRWLGPARAMIAALCLAVSPFYIEYSHSARGYTGLVVTTLLSSYFYLQLLHWPSRRYQIGFVVVSTLGVYFHLYFVLVALVQVVVLAFWALWQLYRIRHLLGRQQEADPALPILTRQSFKTLWTGFMVIGALSLLLYSPVLSQLLQVVLARGRGNFAPEFPLALWATFVGSHSMLVLTATAALVLLGGITLLRRERILGVYILALLIIPFLAVWLSRPSDLFTRFFIYWLPFFSLCCSAGLQVLWNALGALSNHWGRWVVRIPCALLLLAGVLAWTKLSWVQGESESGFREACRDLETNAPETAVFCAIGGDAPMLQYYSHHRLIFPNSVKEVEELIDRNPDLRCVYNRMEWEPTEQTEIAKFLMKRGEIHRIGTGSVCDIICQKKSEEP